MSSVSREQVANTNARPVSKYRCLKRITGFELVCGIMYVQIGNKCSRDAAGVKKGPKRKMIGLKDK